jgi:5'-3' exonuclease
VVQLDRRKRVVTDEAGVVEKFGVSPASIPDYLGLVGDSADGYPGLPGWGAKSAAAVLARWTHLELIPADCRAWEVEVRGRERLCASLEEGRELAYLFRDIATIRTDIPLFGSVDELRWTGPREGFQKIAAYLEWDDIIPRVARGAERVSIP